MKVLAIDTATSACSVAIWQDGDVIARRFEAMSRGQAEFLMPMIGDVLRDAGCKTGDMDLLAVTIGPGAFTGIRIGLAAARGLSLATGLPLVGVTTTDAIAHNVNDESGTTLLVALDSKRADIFIEVFSGDGKSLAGPAAVAPEDLAADMPKGPLAVVGDAADVAICALKNAGVETHLVDAPGTPDAAVVAALAAGRWQPGDEHPAAPSPVYLRPPDATPPKDGGCLRPAQ